MEWYSCSDHILKIFLSSYQGVDHFIGYVVFESELRTILNMIPDYLVGINNVMTSSGENKNEKI